MKEGCIHDDVTMLVLGLLIGLDEMLHDQLMLAANTKSIFGGPNIIYGNEL